MATVTLLMPGLFALGLVEDLGREAVAFRPAQVHAQQHLGPVGGFGSAGAGADRQQRVALVVLAAEEQLAAGLGVLGGELLGFPVDLGEEALVRLFLGQIEQLDGGLGARLEIAPQSELFAQTLSLAQDLLGRALVVPEAWLADGGVQLR